MFLYSRGYFVVYSFECGFVSYHITVVYFRYHIPAFVFYFLQNYSEESHGGLYRCYITNGVGKTMENDAEPIWLTITG